MTQPTIDQTHPPVEYTAALNHLRDVYNTLFDLVNTYPEALRERKGASGWWSPRQVLAHLCGWLAEAIRRYHVFDSGEQGSMEYDDDAFNAQSVEERKDYDWQMVLDELRHSFQEFLSLASRVSPQRAAEDLRYPDWLRGLATDCKEHTKQLREFASKSI
jgi:hypothetical protein